MPSHKPSLSMVTCLLLLPAVAAFTRPASPARVFQLHATAGSDDAGMREKYLSRLGIDAAIVDRDPNAEDLQALLTAHLSSIPFENLGQHNHPSEGLPFMELPQFPSPYYRRSTWTSA